MLKRNHYTSFQRSKHVSSWKKSSKTISEYSSEHGINPLTFTKWIYRNQDSHPAKKLKLIRPHKKFIPIQVIDSPCAAGHGLTKVSIEFPDGTKVHIN